MPSQIIITQQKTNKPPIISPKTLYPRNLREKEVHPNLNFRSPTRSHALHDPENALLSRFGAEMMAKGWSFVWSFNGEWGRKKSNVRKRESCLKKNEGWVKREKSFLVLKKRFSSFSIILFKLCHMSLFDWSKKGPLSLFDCDPYSVTKVRKIWPLKR